MIQIRNIHTNEAGVTVRGPHTLSASGEWVEVMALRVDSDDSIYQVAATMPRADFLAAVEKEAGGTFIADADLPKMDAERAHRRLTTDSGTPPVYPWSLDDPWGLAMELIAAVKYLRANPPVDEAKVDHLAEALEDIFPGRSFFTDDELRRLAARLDIKEQS